MNRVFKYLAIAIVLCIIILMCLTGNVSATTEAMTALAYDEILYFWDELTLEQRAEYSREWIPKVEEELKVNPEYRGVHYYETRHVYGVPSVTDITEEEAVRIATESIETEFGINTVDWGMVYYKEYFDITNADAPLWKFYFAIDEIDPWEFIWVEINAKTGEVKELIKRDSTMQFYDFM